MSNDPSFVMPAIKEMREDWAVVKPLMGGTKAMRAAGKALLPQFPAEEDDAYRARLKLSTLFPAYQETVGNMVSRVFAEPLQLGDDVPQSVKDYCEDIDRSGRDLNSWSVDFFLIGLSQGLCHAFVESPPSKGVKTKAEEQAAGIRPYAVLVRPDQVLGWRIRDNRLVQVRFKETVEEDEGEFGISCIEQIRVLEPGRWRIYRESKDGKGWLLHDEGDSNLSEIPWVTFYTGRTGVMRARPPLIELAYLNVKHWQSQSDQDNLLHVARVPLLFAFTDSEDFQPVVGTGSATRMRQADRAEYVEHSGAAIEAGRTSLLDLIDEMRMTGARLLRKDNPGTKTATQAEDEAAEELSPLERMAHQFQDCLEQLLKFMGDYVGVTSSDGYAGSVEIRGNFDMDFAMETTVPTLVSMAEKGMLSHETLFAEMQRRGVLSDEYKWGTEKERILAQGPVFEDDQIP